MALRTLPWHARLEAGHGSRGGSDMKVGQRRLKYWTARSCFIAASRVENVPRLRRLPVLGLSLREYSRYCPELNWRITPATEVL